MTGLQNVVGFGGAGLVFANFWLGGKRHEIANGLFGSASGNTTTAHGDLLTLGAEMLFVIVATVLAGISDAWASIMAVIVVGLWILWAMNYFGHFKQTTTGGPA